MTKFFHSIRLSLNVFNKFLLMLWVLVEMIYFNRNRLISFKIIAFVDLPKASFSQ